MQATLETPNDRGSYRTTAKIIGAVFLAGMIVYITGNIVVQSILGAADPLASVADSSTVLAIGAMLMLMASAGDAVHGVVMYPS
jgi:hypothetical protein